MNDKRGLIVKDGITYRGDKTLPFEYYIPKWNKENINKFDGIIFQVETIFDTENKVYRKRYVAEDILAKPKFSLTYNYKDAIKFNTIEELAEDVYARVKKMYQEGRIK